MSPTIRRNFLIALLFSTAACHGQANVDIGAAVGPRQLAVGLHNFAGCPDLLTYFQQQADSQMTTQLLANASWAGYCIAEADGSVAAPTAASGAAAGGTPPAFSTTNNQVQGVDEADIVKTFSRGSALYTLTLRAPVFNGNVCTPTSLQIAQIYPVASAKLLASLPVGTSPGGLLLDGNNVLVITADANNALPQSGGAGAMPDVPMPGPGFCGYFYSESPATRVSVVDITNLTAPTVVRERIMQGSYSTARLINDTARVVTNVDGLGPTLQWAPDWSALSDIPMCQSSLSPSDRARIMAAYERVIQSNRAIIYATTLNDWLPYQYDRQNVATQLQQSNAASLDCSTVLRPGDPAGTDVTRITTLSLATAADIQQAWQDVAVVAEGDTVYASASGLYIDTDPYDAAYWDAVETAWQQANTHDASVINFPVERISMHRFDITDAHATTYTNSGSVDGVLVDAYSMDESNGYLRVASTQHRNPWWDQTTSTNSVTVFNVQGPTLAQVGALTNLQPGEHVSAVRFFADKAYINTTQNVTFADPLLTIDLSDPLHPALHATLSVQGSAEYLYPMDANHLIAIGINSGNSWLSSAMLSIYDVTQLDAPVELKDAPLASSGWAYSPALSDPHAFNYFTTQKGGAPLNVLAMPITIYGGESFCSAYNCYASGLRVFSVDLTTPQGFVLLGDVYHDSFTNVSSWGDQGVQRSVIVGPTDTGASYVVSVSNLGIKITDVAALGTAAAGTETPSAAAISF